MTPMEPPVKIQPKWSSCRAIETAGRRPQPPVKPSPPAPSLHRLSTKDLCRLTRQLAALLHAGMPLVPALTALAEQWQMGRGSSLRPVAAIIEQVRDEVNEGGSLAQALQKHPGLFSPLFVSMVSAGENSGALEEVLARVADILQQRAELTDKVKAALAYPALMAVVAVGVVTFLLSYVVPSLTKLFIEMNRPLPAPTRLLIALSDLTRGYLVVLAGLLVALVVAWVALYKSPAGKARLDHLVLRLPVFGSLLFRLELARLTRTLGALMKSGLPVLTAMEITQRVVQNTAIAQALSVIRTCVHQGEALADAVRTTGLFPPVVYHLIATGQLSGTIEDSLLEIATIYDGEVQSSVRTLTALLEPLILLVMGAVVAFIVLAILLPVFEINQAL